MISDIELLPGEKIEPFEPRICAECKHATDVFLCTHELAAKLNVVTGRYIVRNCYEARSVNGVCGVLGALFEAKQ